MFDENVVLNASERLNKQLSRESIETVKTLMPFFIGLFIFIFTCNFLMLFFYSKEPLLKAFFDASWSTIVLSLFSIFFGYLNEGRTFRHQKRIIRNGLKHMHQIEIIIRNKDPYILYLYDFESGRDQIRYKGLPVGGTDGVYYIDGNHRREIISRKFHKKIPVIYLYNYRETNYRYRGYALIVDDSNWLASFKILFNYAKYIVIDYKNAFETSTNIIVEIEYILEQSTKNIVFSGTEKEFSRLTQIYPGIAHNIMGRFRMIRQPTHIESFYGKDDNPYFTIDENDELFTKIK